MELFNREVPEDLHGPCQQGVLHLVHIFSDKWEIYRQRIGGSLRLLVGPAREESDPEAGGPQGHGDLRLLPPDREQDRLRRPRQR